MTTMTTLDQPAVEAIEAAAVVFMETLRKFCEPAGAAMAKDTELEAFIVSVGVQAVGRASLGAAPTPDLTQWALLGCAEGVGMLVALIPDADQRRLMFEQCVQAMVSAVNAASSLHTPQGNA